MRRPYKHLTPEQRVKIKELLDNGYKKAEIADAIDVHISFSFTKSSLPNHRWLTTVKNRSG